jgi:hypothetical protein
MKKIPIETKTSIILTDEFIDQLLGMPKKITSGKIREKQEGKYKRRDFEVRTQDDKYHFEVFTRVNTDLPENFSVGLVWRANGNDIILVRYNGDHGEHTNFLTKEKLKGCHIHKFKSALYEQQMKGENHAEPAEGYATMDEALLNFCKDLKINNFSDYFPDLTQSKIC